MALEEESVSQGSEEERYAAAVDEFETAISQNDGERMKEIIMSNAGLLHYAAERDLLKIVKELLKYGANVNATDSNSITPLHVAAQYASKETVSILLQNGAMYNAADDLETKAIDLAKNEEISQLFRSTEKLFASVLENNLGEVVNLCQGEAILEAKDSEGNTCLHNAAWQGFKKVVEILLEHHVNINARSCTERTPLHYAVQKSHVKIVELLLFHGALFDPVDDNGKTPYDFSVNKVLSNLFKLIRTCFQKIRVNDETVINDITKIVSFETKKAVLGAKNNDGNTLIVEAILRKFSRLDKFNKKLQPGVSREAMAGANFLMADNYKMALKSFESVWKERLPLLGPDNPLTLEAQHRMGVALSTLGRYQESLQIQQSVCEKQTEILGYNAAETLNTRASIAIVMMKLGKDEDASARMNFVSKNREKLCEADSEKLKSLNLTASALIAQQRYDEASKIYNFIHNERTKKLHGADSSQSLLAENNIAVIRFRQGKYEEALGVLKRVFFVRRLLLGSDHLDNIKTMFSIDLVLSQMESDSHEASALRQEILMAKLETAQTMHTRDGKLLNAIKLYREILEPLKSWLGENHENVLICVDSMKSALDSLKITKTDESKVLEYNSRGFMTAVINDNVDDLHDFLNRDGSPDVDGRDEEGRTPLHFAASQGHLKIVEALVARGADVALKTAKGNTSLHTAIAKGSKDIAKTLLRHAMSLGLFDYIDAQTTSNATTALHVAAKNGQLENVRLLLAYGATYDVTNKDGRKPIDLATDKEVRNLLKLIESLFKDVGTGDLLLMQKFNRMRPEDIFPLLCARNIDGSTLMKVAVGFKRKEMVDVLSRIACDFSLAGIYY